MLISFENSSVFENRSRIYQVFVRLSCCDKSKRALPLKSQGRQMWLPQLPNADGQTVERHNHGAPDFQDSGAATSRRNHHHTRQL